MKSVDMSKLTKKQYAKQQAERVLKVNRNHLTHTVLPERPIKQGWAKPVVREGYAAAPSQDLWERPELKPGDLQSRVGLARIS